MLHTLIEEFRDSFLNYVTADSDDRRLMLDKVVVLSEAKIRMMEPHDFAALLTVSARVPSSADIKSIKQRYEAGVVVDQGVLPHLIEYPVSHHQLSSVFTDFDSTVDGRKFLQTVVICLHEANAMPRLRKRLWKP